MNRFTHFTGKTITALTLLGVLMAGCRFGNYSEPPKFPTSKYKSIEIFFNEAKTFQTFAYYDDNTHTENTNASLAHIPSSMSKTMMEPIVYFLVETNNSSYFRGIDDSHTLQVGFKPNQPNQIDVELASGIVPFFGYAACKTQLQIIEEGALNRSQPGSITYGDGTVAPVAGHVNLDLTFIQAFDGDCSVAFQRLAHCYDALVNADCSKDEKAIAVETLDLYAKLSGVLNVADIPKLIGLAYKIHFE